MARRNVPADNKVTKDQPVNQVEALEAEHALVVQLRSEGASLKAITERVSHPSVRVDRNAVDRFCRKHNIPLRQPAKPKPAPEPETEPTAKYEAFPLEPVVVRRKPAVTDPASEVKPLAVPPALPAAPAGQPADEPPVVPDPPATPPQTLPITPARTPSLQPALALSVPPPVVSASPTLPPGVTPDDLAIAKFLNELGPRARAVNEAHARKDFAGTVTAMQKAIAWLESATADVPEHVAELAMRSVRWTRCSQRPGHRLCRCRSR
jgi:hypothetical protein